MAGFFIFNYTVSCPAFVYLANEEKYPYYILPSPVAGLFGR